MKIQITRTTVTTPGGETAARVVEAGEIIEVDKKTAALLLTLDKATAVAAGETATSTPGGETADARPVARKR